MKPSSAVCVLCGVLYCVIIIEKVKAMSSNRNDRDEGSKQQLAVVSVSGDVNKHDDVTLSVTTAGSVRRRRLRRVEYPVLHEQLTTFTVIGDHQGRPRLHWENVSAEARQKAKQFFYDLESGAVVSIITTDSGSRIQVKGFLDHDTRISPVEGGEERRGGRRRKRREREDGVHRVWRQTDNEEWRILSHLGISRPSSTAKRHHQRHDDDDDDDEHETDDGSVHRDDYLEVPAMFLDKSLWITHQNQRSSSHHHFVDHSYHDGDDGFISFDDDDDKRRRRRRRRQSVLDMQHNPFHTTFSSRMASLATFRPPSEAGPATPRPFSGTHVVEAMVMVDVKTYSQFNYDPAQLEDYILHFWQVVNLRLRAIIDPKLQLRIRSYGKILFSGFQQFIEGSRVTVASRSMVSLTGVMEGFRDWMQSYETNTMYSGHDVAILMTGENLCKLAPNGSCPDSPKGIGYMGGACITSRRFMGYTYDVAVAEVDRSYRGVLTATHELGHLLNASHDGEGGARACSSTSGYIMSYSWKNATMFNRFSLCSKVSISRFLTGTWYSECLQDSSDTSYAYRGQLPGLSMPLKDQCLHYNAGVPCSSRSLQSQCQNLCCENILKVSLSSEPAVDGTECGPGKMCFAGRCLQNEAVSKALL